MTSKSHPCYKHKMDLQFESFTEILCNGKYMLW